MRWARTTAGDPRAVELHRRHYTYRGAGRPADPRARVAPPGRRLVLITPEGDAVWTTSSQDYAAHDWRGAWVCSLFRNESGHLSSDLILEALAASQHALGPMPPEGIVTFIDPCSVRPKRDPGYCYVCAGFERVGRTSGGHGRPSLLVLHLPPSSAPAPAAPLELAPALFA